MNSEERFERIEKKIEFIVNQQAQFTTDLQALQQTQAAMQLQINKLNEAMLTLAVAQVRTEAKFAALAEAQAKLAEAQAKGDEGMRRLEEKGAETEERLNAFINFVERYLSDRQKGNAEGDVSPQ